MKFSSRLSLWGIAIATSLLPIIIATPSSVAAATMTGTCGSNLICVQTFGKQQIDVRVASLNTLIATVQTHAYLTDAQKNVIQNDLKSSIPGLQALEKQLMGETVIANARDDVHAIYANFRIYAIVLPRDSHEVWLDHLSNLHDNLVAGEPTINQAIQAASNKGINVTQEQAQDADLVAKVSDAGTQITSAQNLVASLIPANYPATNQTLTTMRAEMKVADTDLGSAAKDLHQITQELEAAGA